MINTLVAVFFSVCLVANFFSALELEQEAITRGGYRLCSLSIAWLRGTPHPQTGPEGIDLVTQTELSAESKPRNGGALDVPARSSPPPRRLPARLLSFGRLPQGKVSGVPLARVAWRDRGAR